MHYRQSSWAAGLSLLTPPPHTHTHARTHARTAPVAPGLHDPTCPTPPGDPRPVQSGSYECARAAADLACNSGGSGGSLITSSWRSQRELLQQLRAERGLMSTRSAAPTRDAGTVAAAAARLFTAGDAGVGAPEPAGSSGGSNGVPRPPLAAVVLLGGPCSDSAPLGAMPNIVLVQIQCIIWKGHACALGGARIVASQCVCARAAWLLPRSCPAALWL